MIAGRSWPSISRPHSSLVVKSIGPTIRSRPRARSQASAAASRACAVSGSSSDSKNPHRPQSFFWWSLKFRSTCAVIRPTGRPSRQARKYSASACLKNGLRLPVQPLADVGQERGDPPRLVTIELEREADEALEVARSCDGTNLETHREEPIWGKPSPTSLRRSATTSGSPRCAPPATPVCCRSSARSPHRRCRSSRWRAGRGSCSAPTTISA